MKLSRIRSKLYRAASLLGDLQAVLNGTIIQRLGRKFTYKWTFQRLSQFWGLFK